MIIFIPHVTDVQHVTEIYIDEEELCYEPYHSIVTLHIVNYGVRIL